MAKKSFSRRDFMKYSTFAAAGAALAACAPQMQLLLQPARQATRPNQPLLHNPAVRSP